MKKLLIPALFFSFSIYSQDSLMAAIKKSNPELVKEEIDQQIKSKKTFTKEEQCKYIDFCEEIIIRRRNAIQFPQHYYKGTPIYTKAFSTDENPAISLNCVLRGIIGFCGALIALPLFLDQYPKIAIASELGALILLVSARIEAEKTWKFTQEQLYENAIEIKHLIMNLRTA